MVADMQIALTILHIVITAVLMVIVLVQEGRDAGMGGALSGGSSDTFFGKNKGRTKEALLKKLTTVFAILFIASSLALGIFFK
jgi:preprotein translocase subunit SecG